MKMFWLGLVALTGLVGACDNGNDATEEAGYGPMQAEAAPMQQGEPGMTPPPAAGAPRALPPGVVRMQKVDIIDPKGFERPMTAGSILIPAGWRAQGGFVWGPYGQCGPDYALNWTITSPDGSQSLTAHALQSWSGTRSEYPGQTQGGCETAFFSSARELLQAVAQKAHPNARILDYRPLPEEAKPLNDILSGPEPSSPGLRSEIYADAGEILIAYNENGHDMREALGALAIITHVQMTDLGTNRVGLESISGLPATFVAWRAPNGQLDLDLAKRVMSSFRATPEWAQRIAAFQAQKARSQMKAATDAHNARMSAIKAAGDIQNGIYRDQDLASDRAQRERIETIRGVETYYDPEEGGPVQLDNMYNDAWRVKGDNTYILSNDPNFKPGQYGIDAQQLKVMQ